MSAWIVSKRHIDYLVKGAMVYGEGVEMPIKADSATEFGRELLRECVASVAYRYDHWVEAGEELPGHRIRPNRYRYAEPKLSLDEGVYYKQLACYAYQSCEHPEWESSPSKAFIDLMTGILVKRMGFTSVDTFVERGAWNSAPWGID